MAHSLGNHVAYEAMRLHAINRLRNPAKPKLFNTMVSAEPAVWGETFWPQRPVSVRVNPLDIFRTDYSEDDLRWNSWAFWFNQTGHPAKSAVNNLVSQLGALGFRPGADAIRRMHGAQPGRSLRHPGPSSWPTNSECRSKIVRRRR